MIITINNYHLDCELVISIMKWKYCSRENILFSTCKNPTIHLFYPPKQFIGIVLDFSWDIFMSREKLQTMMQNLEGGGG